MQSRWLWFTLGIALLVMVGLDRPLIRGDGVAYLAWVDSFILDSDINFDNQLERLQPVNSYQLQWNDTTQRLVNIFPFGIAILQTPFYAIGHLFAINGWWDANPDYFHRMQGVWRPYSMWLMIGSNVMGLAIVGLSWDIARRFTTPAKAALATVTIFLGTPLLYYLTVAPLNSHNAGAFTFTLFLWLALRIEKVTGQPKNSHAQNPNSRQETKNWLLTTGYWSLIGIMAGLMVLSRWQLFLVAAPAWPILFWRQRWQRPLIAMCAAAVVCLPLPLSWNVMFGAPFVIPYDAVNDSSSFLSLPRNALDVLVQTMAHSPVILLALFGVWALWAVERRWALFAICVIVLQLYVNGGVLDWWAGETYGMRRMSELFPLYVLLVGALLQRVARGHVVEIVLGGLIVWSLLYLIIFVNYTWTNQDGVFINHVPIMWRHFWSQPHRWQITWEVWQSHLGPLSWSMPGP